MKKSSYLENNEHKRKHELVILLSVMTILNILFYWKFIIGKEYFLVSSDVGIQQYAALVRFIEHFKEGLKGWSFLDGMGNSYDFSSYVISPNILLLLFGRENLKYTFIWYHLVKMYLAAIIFYFALNKIGINKKAAVYGALCYVYSAPFIVRSFWASYALEFVIFALVLYALECYFQDNNWKLLILAIFLVGSQLQLYHMVVYAVAMLFYALIRNYLVTNHKGKEFWKYIGKCSIIMIVSVILLLYRLVPEVVSTFSSSRVASVGTQMQSSTTWMELFKIASPDRLIAVFNSFFAISLEGSIGNTTFCSNALDGPLFYVGVLALVLFPQCFKLFEKKGKKIWIGLVLFIVAYCMIPGISYVCNLGADEDYFKLSTMWMSVLLIASAAFVLGRIWQGTYVIDKALLWITYGILLLSFVGVNLGNAEFRSRVNIIMLIKVIFYLSVWVIFLLLCEKVKNKKIIYCIFGILICSEIYFFVHPTMTTAENLADGLKYAVDFENNQKLIDEVKAIEPDEFYRIYFRDSRMFDYNTESVLCNFNSMGYGSQNVKSGYVNFLNAIESEPTYRPVWKRSNGFLSRYMIDSLASVKYAILEENEVPPRGFEKLGEEDNYIIYRNKYSMPLGVVMDKVISSEEFENLSIRQKDVALLNGIVSDEVDVGKLESYENILQVDSEKIALEDMILEGMKVDKEKTGEYKLYCESEELNRISIPVNELKWNDANEYIISFEFYTPCENNIFVQWNENGEWKQKILEVAEGKNTVNFTIDCNQTDVVLLYFQQGEYEINNLHYESSNSQQIDQIYEMSTNNRQYLKMTSFCDNRIEGTIESQKDAYLFFMIPYDNNWKAYVDGKSVEVKQVDYGFMGVDIKKGNHTIKMEYVPNGL